MINRATLSDANIPLGMIDYSSSAVVGYVQSYTLKVDSLC